MESPRTPAKIKSFYINDLEAAHLRFLSSQIVGSAKRRKLNSTRKGAKSFVESVGSSVSDGLFNKSLAAQSYIPSRSTKPLTEPIEFHFQTENRNKKKALPKPSTPFVSLAQKVKQFHNKTPKRFRSMARNARMILRPPSPPLHLTVPQEFSFETEARSRPPAVLSTQEREELEMQQMPKFVARPVDRKVLAGHSQLNTSVFHKSLTETEEFHFHTEERSKLKRREPLPSPEPGFKFQAVPVDESVLYGPVKGVPSLSHKVLTVPESPILTTKYRAAMQPAPIQTEPEVFVFKAQPMPISKPFVPAHFEKTLTVPEPFDLSTEARGKVAKEKLERELEEEAFRADQMRLFKAQPLPISEPFEIAPYERQLTVPEPFHLESEERGERYQETVFKPTIQAERKKEIENTHFKATPLPIATPFQPEKSSKPLTVLDDVKLNSESRSKRRAAFDQQMTQKTKQAEENKKKKEQEDEVEQKKELKELRKRLVHKPLPVMQAKPFVLKPTASTLTRPETPNLRTRTRATLHNGRDI
eukprot:TRINITY_DN4466_c0_g1_i2.p1 TRINITY_DN4466_c0_g1~~TRINITY_DN4466_c0_g1_i2.p1  ORF type:complete len:530 (-),score=128.17 TRINITY_DN4466_c0_g1_i2:107-1696(-)